MKPVPTIEFFFDLSSPWTYLAFYNIQPLAEARGVTIQWRPILVGGVFNAVNQEVYQGRAATDSPKMRHFFKALQDWAAWSGLPLNFPSPHHPAKSVIAMRACCVLEAQPDRLVAFAMAAFRAYFVEQQNIDDPQVIEQIARSIGEDGKALLAAAGSADIKDRLRASTQEVIDRGGYGSPTIFLDGDDMYFGNDQLPLLERALGL